MRVTRPNLRRDLAGTTVKIAGRISGPHPPCTPQPTVFLRSIHGDACMHAPGTSCGAAIGPRIKPCKSAPRQCTDRSGQARHARRRVAHLQPQYRLSSAHENGKDNLTIFAAAMQCMPPLVPVGSSWYIGMLAEVLHADLWILNVYISHAPSSPFRFNALTCLP